MRKIGVFIPGRLQSERLPNKLILPIGTKSLWEIACDKVNRLPKEYGKYALVEDETELKVIADKFPNIHVIVRSHESVMIDSPNSEIFADLKDIKEDYLMFLNPCLLFLSLNTIQQALKYFSTQTLHESLTSVKPFTNWLYHKGQLCTEVNKESWSTKEIVGYQQAAHCFHIFSKELLFKHNRMLGDKHAVYEIQEKETIDVDTEHDYNIARFLYEKEKSDSI